MFSKKYEIVDDAPPPISWDDYAKTSYIEYQNLLEAHSDNEAAFQSFLEANPSYVPGAFELFGTSGHYPFSQSLIAQPKLNGGPFTRVPDFVWLAQDSLSFTPVLIEIERPSKKMFTQEGTPTAHFYQALNQIIEWKTILGIPENVLQFYNCFDIPDWIRKKTFAPQYGLIYGRRSEYEKNAFLTQKRAQLAPNNVKIISFDRLNPDPKCDDLLCTSLSAGQYSVKTIPPTYRYSPALADNFALVSGFDAAIPRMQHTSAERKAFLLKRYPYWCKYGQSDRKGIYCPSDRE